VDRNQFLHWLEQIYSTHDKEIDCEKLRDFLPAYVDFEVTKSSQTPVGDRLELVTAHLAQCPDCAEEHAALFTVARMLADGNLPLAEKSLALFEEEPALEGEVA
jgi:predicted anti-sigma-YlaC factor YlaD